MASPRKKSTASRKGTAARGAAGKPARKKATTKKATVKKTPTKKTPTKKTPTKKTPTKKTTAKKATAKKTAAKKTAAKKTAAKKTATKKTAAKKTAAKKTAAKKTAAKKTAAKKAVTKKAAAKKTATPTRARRRKAPLVVAPPPPPPPVTATSTLGELGIEPYVEQAGEEYMNPRQVEHFRHILTQWRQALMEEVDRTMHHMQDDATNFPDPNDRATQEEEFALELRTRDRERKLIRKINESLAALDTGEYGYCEACGVEIGIRRLEARPTATLCIDCKTLDEIRERSRA